MDFKLYLIIYIILINIISFFVMKSDKKKAINHEMRISERTIFLFALILGSTGVYAGMKKYRHKTKHLKFIILIPILIVVNIFTIYYIFNFI